MSCDIIWADDDAKGFLALLVDEFEHKQIHVEVALDFGAAVELCERHGDIKRLLVDAILPDLGATGSIAMFLGLRLARHCVSKAGYTRVAVLSVVSQAQLQRDLDTLISKSSADVIVKYFDKTKLLEPGAIDTLVDFLKS